MPYLSVAHLLSYFFIWFGCSFRRCAIIVHFTDLYGTCQFWIPHEIAPSTFSFSSNILESVLEMCHKSSSLHSSKLYGTCQF